MTFTKGRIIVRGKLAARCKAMLIVDRSSKTPIGLMILFETTGEGVTMGIEVRLGYLLAEAVWGKGLASELLGGFVTWCRKRTGFMSIAGGVDKGNIASRRVLEKSGFVRAQNADQGGDGEWLYRLKL